MNYHECELGKIILIKLFEINKSQKWLAEQCNVTETTISYIINGKRRPSKKLIYGISKILSLDLKLILNSMNDMSSEAILK